ncbi:MAG: alpha/beta hydrolase family protein [Gemmatimonadaceae bacterium]
MHSFKSSISSILIMTLVASSAAGQSVASPSAIDTVPPSSVIESSYAIQSGGLTLPGTLTLPAKTASSTPVALIVAGSGPTDRNGNSAGALRAQNNSNLYAILAWQLANVGIASVRYDKRALGENIKKIDIAQTSIDDFVDDVLAGARQLAGDKRFTKVVLIGHSEGAELVLQAANRGAPASGIIMLAGTGRPIAKVLREQIARQLSQPDVVKWDSAFARYLRGESPGDVHPALMSLLAPVNRKFMQSWVTYDPAAEIGRAKLPILIVQGSRDLQVSEADALALKAAQPAAKLVVLPTANHVFRSAANNDRMEQLRLYTNPTIPVVGELTPTIADWIKSLK